jgi:hypothetical protein
MKVSKSEVEKLREAISPLDTEERRHIYLDGDFPRSQFVKDLDMRYRWDLYWACGVGFEDNNLMDSHIDTALKAIVPKLEV